MIVPQYVRDFLYFLAFWFSFGLIFIVPNRVRNGRAKYKQWLKGYFCHRGLYTKDQRVSENSMGAFARAMDLGYGIELDVQLSLDGKVYVFHDDDTLRMTGVSGILEEKTSDEIDQLRLIGSGEKIPLLSEVLTLVGGKVPMLVELKTTKRKEKSVKAVIAIMKDYRGDYAYCSFDPLILGFLYGYAPKQLRGLNMEYSLDKKQFDWLTRIILQFALLNFTFKPDYLSVDYTHVPFVYKFWRSFGAFGMKWAVPSQEEDDELFGSCETVIFEHYLPRQR
jgi:hypothetical protein